MKAFEIFRFPDREKGPNQSNLQAARQQTLSSWQKDPYPINSLKAQKLIDSTITYLVKDLRPITTVASENFKNFLREFDPRFELPSKTYFRDNVLIHKYQDVKGKVLQELQSGIERHAITTDAWTSQMTIDYVTVTCHAITPEFNMKSYVLQTRPLGEAHTADNLAKLLLNVQKDWGLKDPFGVTDNARNTVKPFQDILLWPHLGCLGHTLNLAVVKCFNIGVVSKLLAKLRRMVGYFKRSTSAARSLREKQGSLGLPILNLISDCETRWNSTLDMISRVLQQEPAICAVLMSSDKRDDRSMSLTDDEVRHMHDLVGILGDFKKSTLLLSGQKLATCSYIWPTLIKLKSKVLAANDDDPPFVKDVKAVILRDLDSRYKSAPEKEFLGIATFLDPRFKSLCFIGEQERLKVFESVRDEAIRISNIPPVVKQEPQAGSNQSSQSNLDDDAKPDLGKLDDPQVAFPKLELSEDQMSDLGITPRKRIKTEEAEVAACEEFFNDIMITKVEAVSVPLDKKISNEIESYRSAKDLGLKDDPLQWWKSNAIFLPDTFKTGQKNPVCTCKQCTL